MPPRTRSYEEILAASPLTAPDGDAASGKIAALFPTDQQRQGLVQLGAALDAAAQQNADAAATWASLGHLKETVISLLHVAMGTA